MALAWKWNQEDDQLGFSSRQDAFNQNRIQVGVTLEVGFFEPAYCIKIKDLGALNGLEDLKDPPIWFQFTKCLQTLRPLLLQKKRFLAMSYGSVSTNASFVPRVAHDSFRGGGCHGGLRHGHRQTRRSPGVPSRRS